VSPESSTHDVRFPVPAGAGIAAVPAGDAPENELDPFDPFLDVRCPVSVVLGTGTISVRQCLALERHSVVKLAQPAGEDLRVLVDGVAVARGEVVIVDDSAAIRLTEITRARREGGR
jgi:flagellar motor switch protein FliN/FliY